MMLKNLIGVATVNSQKILQEPLYTPNGNIDWQAMEEAQQHINIFVDHETQTISFNMREGGCTPDDLIAIADLIMGRILQ